MLLAPNNYHILHDLPNYIQQAIGLCGLLMAQVTLAYYKVRQKDVLFFRTKAKTWGHLRLKLVGKYMHNHLLRTWSAAASSTLPGGYRPWPTLTCGGQHGARKKQRRGEVPVPVHRGVIEDGYAVITGLQGFLQEPLESLLRQTIIFLEELFLDGPQLLAQEVFIWQLHRWKHNSAEYEIKEVPQH